MSAGFLPRDLADWQAHLPPGNPELESRRHQGELPNHRLIMFVGSPGAGKSTTSSSLYQDLIRRGVPASLLPEQDVYRLDALQASAKELNRSEPGGISGLLDAIRALCAEWRASDAVWITDQFLPAFHWLHGKYEAGQVETYAGDLSQILRPLRSLVVYLDADVGTAWRRAVDERGQEWSDWMVDVFTSRGLPRYPGRPLKDLGTLLQFFAWERECSLAQLARWPEDQLILQTTVLSPGQVLEVVLEQVG